MRSCWIADGTRIVAVGCTATIAGAPGRLAAKQTTLGEREVLRPPEQHHDVAHFEPVVRCADARVRAPRRRTPGDLDQALEPALGQRSADRGGARR